MNGRNARIARSIFKSVQDVARFPAEVRHHNVRQKNVTVPTGIINPSTGKAEVVTFSFATSTEVIPVRAFYRGVKRDLQQNRRS